MSYRLKGPQVIIEGDINKIVPQVLPGSPVDGQFVVDIADKKMKVWNDAEGRWIILGEALDQKFLSTTTTPDRANAFVSQNTQEAIEEARNQAISASRFCITTFFNGTIGNNNWLGFSEVLPGNQVPIRLPIKCRLKEIQFSYSASTLIGIPISSNNVDGHFDLYKNGLTSPGNVVFQGTFTNDPGGKYFTAINVDFNPGDFMVGRWVDQGDNPSDMAIVYFFEVLQ
jgi:hypothetical protein